MSTLKRRLAISGDDGYVLGLNAVVTGPAIAANALGNEVVGIHVTTAVIVG